MVFTGHHMQIPNRTLLSKSPFFKGGLKIPLLFSGQSLMSPWLSQKNEKGGGAGLRARHASGGQGRPPHRLTAGLLTFQGSKFPVKDILSTIW
jgi:hypothetical protein